MAVVRKGEIREEKKVINHYQASTTQLTKVSLALVSPNTSICRFSGSRKDWEGIQSAIVRDNALSVGQCMCDENAIGINEKTKWLFGSVLKGPPWWGMANARLSRASALCAGV